NKDNFSGMTEEEAEAEVNRLRKRRKRRAATLVVVITLLVIAAILLPNFFKYIGPKVDLSNVNVNSQTLDYTVAKKSIVRDLTASGSLAAGETNDMKIAGDIEIDEFFVKNGDVIKKGDKIAAVSKPSVMSAIVEVQNTIKSLDTKLNKINSSDNTTVIKADSKARVKAIYVKKGSNAKNTISQYGALMLLSLDGLMAVDIDRTENTKLGDSITVVLSDKTKVSGLISSVNTDYVTCVISDKTAKYKDKVTVLDASGKQIGSSELYIHSVLPIMSYSGAVSKVSVKLNQQVKKDAELLTLTGTRYSGEFSNLMYKRSVLEDQMKYLFEVYQTGIIYSEHDGEVTGINDQEDEEEEEEDSDEKSSTSTSKLSAGPKKLSSLTVKIDNDSTNPPEKVPTTGFVNYAFTVAGFSTTGGVTKYSINASSENVQQLPDVDYEKLPDSITKRDQYKYSQQGGLEIGSSVPVYSYDKTTGSWVKESADKIAMGDLLIITFAPSADPDADPVWVIRYPQTSADPDQGGGDQGGGDQGGGGQGGQGGQGGWNGRGGSGGFDWSSLFGGRGGNSFGGRTGIGSVSGNQGGTATQAEEETYEVEETLIATVVNLETMSVTLSVDELDIININKAQEVDVTLDAVKGKTYKGKIVSIDTDGTRSSSGNAKYSVKIEIQRTDDMLTNMTATVRANISTAEVLSVPAESLFEKDNKTYCYTSYDKEKDIFSGEVEVKTGLSDGKNVEIVSGLNEGDQIWYKYAEGLVYKFVR
nr:HlyD family efflux transporter periplasmic adaptor subunit [Saccharofermentans sp.]